MEDCRKKGRYYIPPGARGGANPCAVLTNQQAAAIRRIWTGDRGQQSALAKQFAVSRSVISAVVRGKRYKKPEHYQLSPAKVRQIRRVASGWYGDQKTLARRFGVTQGTISDILCGRTWKHLLPKKGGAL